MFCQKSRPHRHLAHQAFDWLWQSGRMSRSAAYEWLAGKMGLELRDCHMSYFGVKECADVVLIMMTARVIQPWISEETRSL